VGANQIAENYDEVPYVSKPYKDTHPQSLAVIAAMAGLETAPPNRCRVLEIGCAGGGNLLPMADVFPNSHFVGMDISSVQIEQARAMAGAAEIGNVEFHCRDIREFTPDGEFDFIICHGVYSWVPGDVRDRMLAMCREHLSPRGVTFISHMVLPGAYVWLSLRHAMQLIPRGSKPTEIAAAARAAADAMAELSPKMAKYWGGVVATWARQLSAVDSDLLHDQLAETYHPVYLTDFVEHTSRFGLRFLSDTERHDAKDMHPAAKLTIGPLTSEPVIQMQLLDIARFRMYRQSILARSDAPLATPDPLGVAERSHIASAKLLPDSGQPKAPELPANPIMNEPLAMATLKGLAGRWPRTMSFPELAKKTYVEGTGDPGRVLAHLLLQLHRIGYVELWLHEPIYIGDSSDPTKARTSKLARAQAKSGGPITNLRHVALDRNNEPLREIVAELDGTAPSAEALQCIASLARNSMLLAE
jgi:2-polyprenyl-3-methyl-5-hydroxy-6-metoxy-1,4-benzoquinol methylase